MVGRQCATCWAERANLAEMSGIGLPVPPGFTISTDVCTYFYDRNHTYPDTLEAEVRAAIVKIEAETGSTFADPKIHYWFRCGRARRRRCQA